MNSREVLLKISFKVVYPCIHPCELVTVKIPDLILLKKACSEPKRHTFLTVDDQSCCDEVDSLGISRSGVVSNEGFEDPHQLFLHILSDKDVDLLKSPNQVLPNLTDGYLINNLLVVRDLD